MTVVAIAMVRDEADIIASTVGRMLEQVDHVIVADNASTDGTRDILTELGVEIVDDPEVGYYQARKMTALAARAAQLGATWVVPFDADEVWYSPFGRIADVLGARPEALAATAELYDHLATGDDPEGADPVVRMGWRLREASGLAKVACRPVVAATIHQGNHGVDYGPTLTLPGLLVVRHYPYRSAAQMIRKARNGAAAYAATDLPEDAGKHWRDYGRLSDDQIREAFDTWFHFEAPESAENMILDPCPL